MVTARRTIEEEENERDEDQRRWRAVSEAVETSMSWRPGMTEDEELALVLSVLAENI